MIIIHFTQTIGLAVFQNKSAKFSLVDVKKGKKTKGQYKEKQDALSKIWLIYSGV